MKSDFEIKEQKRKWYIKNKKRLKEKHRKYRQENIDKIKNYSNKYRLDNAEYYREYNKEYYIENKDIIKKRTSEYYNDNKDHVIEYKKKYSKLNKDKMNKYANIYRKERKKIDDLYKLKCNIRSLILNSINRNGYKKESTSCEIIGCSFDEFKLYLESKFESWMNWENYGMYNGELNHGWDIDHIIPVSTATTKEELIKLNHYNNLHPLCSKINRDIKIDRIDYAY